jgi:hypothetical protein
MSLLTLAGTKLKYYRLKTRVSVDILRVSVDVTTNSIGTYSALDGGARLRKVHLPLSQYFYCISYFGTLSQGKETSPT